MSDLDRTCYRHPDRRAGVSCQRCERPICPSCMVTASVGFHCPECTRTSGQKVLRAGQWATRPIVTQVLIAINVGVFLVGLSETSNDLLAGRTGYIADGGLLGPAVVAGDWWRIISAGFLHAGVLHLAFNMLALYVLGMQLEALVGRLQFAVVYGTSLLAGSLGVLVLDPDSLRPTVGASGAVFGLLGTIAAYQMARGISIWDSGLGGILMINLFISFLPGISLGGHLGGFVGGFVCGWILFQLGPRSGSKVLPVLACAAFGAACFVAALNIAQPADVPFGF